MATSGQAKRGHNNRRLVRSFYRKNSKFLYKSGHINRLVILSADILSGIYCISELRNCTWRKNLLSLTGREGQNAGHNFKGQ